MRRSLISAVVASGVCLMLWGAPAAAPAAEKSLEPYNLKIDDGCFRTVGWESVGAATAQPEVIRVRVNKETKESFTILARNVEGRRGTLDQATIAKIEKEALAGAQQKLASRTFTFEGIPAYELRSLTEIEGQKALAVIRLYLTKKYLYVVVGITLNEREVAAAVSQPDQRRGVDSLVESVRFIQRPEPPPASTTLRNVCYAVAGALVIGLIYLVIVRQSKSRGGSRPPAARPRAPGAPPAGQ